MKDVGVPCQADHTLLDPGAAGVVDTYAWAPGTNRQVHHLAHLLRKDLTERAAEDARVVREEKDLPPVNRAIPGHHAITRDFLFAHSEGLGPVDREGVQLGEGSWIQEQIDALARGQLSLGVLLLRRIAAPVHGVVFALAQQIYLALRRRRGLLRAGIPGLARHQLREPGRYSPKASRNTPHTSPMVA